MSIKDKQIELADQLEVAARNLIHSSDDILKFSKYLLKLSEAVKKYESYKLGVWYQKILTEGDGEDKQMSKYMVYCSECEWKGCAEECIVSYPNNDNYGSLGYEVYLCPKCNKEVLEI